MSVQPTKKMKKRLWAGVVCFIAAASYIVLNLINTSLIENKRYQELANRQQFTSSAIHANRGSILDRGGNVLARSSTVYNIIIDPATFQQLDIDKVSEAMEGKGKDYKMADLIADEMVKMFGVNRDDVIDKTTKNNQYQVIKKKVSKQEADAVREFCDVNNISSIYPEQDTRRYYPLNDLAAAVIGFLDGDGAGQYGLEAYYDDYLAGVDGRMVFARNAMGQEMPYRYEKTYDAQDGSSLILTLDSTVQFYLEKYLEEAVATYKAQQRACGIIMEVKTGKILGMATVGGFDLNNPGEIYDKAKAAELEALPEDEYKTQYAIAREMQWKNKAITESYYPGSVFKVITGSAALEEKAVNLNTTFSCHPMLYNGMSKPFNCWTRNSHGTQNFVQAMTNSCNPAFIQIGEKLGADKFCEYYLAYGLTERTGIDLPSEASSSNLYVPRSRMGVVELGSSSFGQTNKVTPIQMITAYAAAINGGQLLTPYVVDKIQDTNGNIIKENQPQVRRQVISAETSEVMRQVLGTVVQSNRDSNAYIEGYQIGGKSGTSQKQDENNRQGRDDLYVSSYVGFAPADDPEIIVLVMVDEPSTGEYYGSKVAVPAVRGILEEALPYLGYYPQYTEEELAVREVAIPSLEGQTVGRAVATLTDLGLTFEVIGENTEDGALIEKQVPSRGISISRNGKVILYTDTDFEEEYARVPNVMGMTVSDVNKALTDAGLNVRVSGSYRNDSAHAVLQNWAEGSIIKKGTIVEVMFAVDDQIG